MLRKFFKSLYKLWRISNLYGIRVLWDAPYYNRESIKYNIKVRNEKLGKDWRANRPKVVKELRKRDDNKCFWCGEHVGGQPTIDHIKPLSKGGNPTDLRNLRLIHNQCRKQRDQAIYSGQVTPDWELGC